MEQNLCDIINAQMRKLGLGTHLEQKGIKVSRREIELFDHFGEPYENCLQLPIKDYKAAFLGIKRAFKVFQQPSKSGIDSDLETKLNALESRYTRFNDVFKWMRGPLAYASLMTAFCIWEDHPILAGVYAGASYAFSGSGISSSPKLQNAFYQLGAMLTGGAAVGGVYDYLNAPRDASLTLPIILGVPSIILGENLFYGAQRRFFPALRGKIKEIRSSFKEIGELSKRVRELGYVLREIEVVQNTSAAYAEENAEKLALFEEACKQYLFGENSRRQIGDCRMALIGGRNTTSIEEEWEQEESVLPVLETFKKQQAKQPNHPDTYSLAMELELGYEVAKRVARTVSKSEVEYVIGRLSHIAGENAKQLIQANPGLLFMKRKECERFAVDLEATLQETEGQEDLKHDLISNPVLYASKEGLAHVREFLHSSREDQKIEALPAGLNPELVDAMLTRGFRLGLARPYIGMRYLSNVNLRHSTANQVGGELMRMFDTHFRYLIREQVILTDKEGKKAAGAGGCYSVNPHLSDIKDPALRLFVENRLYKKQSV